MQRTIRYDIDILFKCNALRVMRCTTVRVLYSGVCEIVSRFRFAHPFLPDCFNPLYSFKNKQMTGLRVPDPINQISPACRKKIWFRQTADFNLFESSGRPFTGNKVYQIILSSFYSSDTLSTAVDLRKKLEHKNHSDSHLASEKVSGPIDNIVRLNKQLNNVLESRHISVKQRLQFLVLLPEIATVRITALFDTLI